MFSTNYQAAKTVPVATDDVDDLETGGRARADEGSPSAENQGAIGDGGGHHGDDGGLHIGVPADAVPPIHGKDLPEDADAARKMAEGIAAALGESLLDYRRFLFASSQFHTGYTAALAPGPAVDLVWHTHQASEETASRHDNH